MKYITSGLSKNKLYILFLILVGASIYSTFNLFNTNFIRTNYNNLRANFLILPKLHQIDKITHELNYKKIFKSKFYNEGDERSLNLILSLNDIEDIEKTYTKSEKKGFINDADKNWRKIKLQYARQAPFDVNLKIHGTSNKPYERSNSLSEASLLNGGAGFKLKLKKKSGWINGVRRLNLSSSYDDWSSISNTLNRYVYSKNLITTFGEPTRLFVNGIEVGVYLMFEDINEELLERDYQITSWAEFKTNDDWDKASGRGHLSATDFSAFDKEQSGNNDFARMYGQFKLQQLMKAIKFEDIETIRSLLIEEQIQWISALKFLLGTIHPIAGDNKRYIYDLSSGRFNIAFRIEGNPQPNSLTPGLLKQSINKYFGEDKILKIFEKDNDFLKERNLKLFQIIKDWPELERDILKDLNLNAKTFNASSKITNHLIDKDLEALGHIRNNILSIKNYLNYAKIYITKELLGNKTKLDILLDSEAEFYLTGYQTCNGDAKNFKKSYSLINSGTEGKYEIINSYEFSEKDECFSKYFFKNKITGNQLEQKHIYENKIIRFDNAKLEERGLTQINFTQNNNTITIKEGSYLVKDDLIFPRNINVTVLPGAEFLLNPNVNIVFSGNVKFLGNSEKPINFRSKEKAPFGTIAFIGKPEKNKTLEANFLHVENGSETYLFGIYFSGQFATKYYDVKIFNSTFKNAQADDGINIKNGFVNLKNNLFIENFGDQIDLDFTFGTVEGNNFKGAKFLDLMGFNNDGLDVSGSRLRILNNIFENNNDKGVSVGEASVVYLTDNQLINNRLGIAIKDQSTVCLDFNKFQKNVKNFDLYVKKKFFSKPEIFHSSKSNLNHNSVANMQSKTTYKSCNHSGLLND